MRENMIENGLHNLEELTKKLNDDPIHLSVIIHAKEAAVSALSAAQAAKEALDIIHRATIAATKVVDAAKLAAEKVINSAIVAAALIEKEKREV